MLLSYWLELSCGDLSRQSSPLSYVSAVLPQPYEGLKLQDLRRLKDMLIVETADMLQAPLFTAEALLRAHGGRSPAPTFGNWDSRAGLSNGTAFFFVFLFTRLGPRKAAGSMDVGCGRLLPALRRSDAHPATQRVQRVGHPAFASHPEDATVTFDSHAHLSNRQLPHTRGGGPVHGEAQEPTFPCFCLTWLRLWLCVY